MVDFSDIVPQERVDKMYNVCPVCETEFSQYDTHECPTCKRLYEQDWADKRYPPGLNDHRTAFTLPIWQKYRMIEHKYAEGEYTADQVKKLVHDLNEYAIREDLKREAELHERTAEETMKQSIVDNLKSRNNYLY